MEAIILIESSNLANIDLGYYNLLSYQVKWLNKNGFNKIILASKEFEVSSYILSLIEFSKEPYKLGTGGAITYASRLLEGDEVYVMNIDDIVFYNPRMLYVDTEYSSMILVSKPRIRYGKVKLRKNMVIRFQEKPYVDMYVSCGHYYFKKHIIDKYFPDYGSLEEDVLPILAKERLLGSYKFQGTWISINNYRDIEYAKEVLSKVRL